MKILIIYATAGAGHRRAAEAIFNAVVKCGRHDVKLIDSLDYTNNFFKKIYSEGYRLLISKCSFVWAVLYYALDNPIIYAITYPLRKLTVYLNSKRLVDYINTEKPDIIISTQFFANEVINAVKKQGIVAPKVVCVITDFNLHSIWLSKAIDLYIVAADKTKRDLVLRGVPENKIKVFGIPVDSKFSDSYNREEIAGKLEINPDRFTALIMTGGFGIGPIEEIAQKLKEDVQLLVVCGRNKKLYGKLRQKEVQTTKVYGLVDNVHELMSVSDIIITKPGGLSVSESLVKNLAMIFISIIPGQESKNARFIVDQGLGVIPKDVDSLVDVVRQWKDNPDILGKIKKEIKQLSFSSATDKIIDSLG